MMKTALFIVAGLLLVWGLLAGCRRKGPPEEAPSADGWQSYTSPAGFYTVEHPSSWRVAREENIVNITPEDESGAVTISAFHADAPIPDLAATWLRDSFEDQTPTSEPKSLSLHGWTGITQTFQDSKDKREWIAIVAQSGKVLVFITANDEQQPMAVRRATYERILQSLRLEDN